MKECKFLGENQVKMRELDEDYDEKTKTLFDLPNFI